MEGKFLVLILLCGALTVMGEPTLKDGGECDFNVERYECGWPGIDKATCLKRNCCWDDSHPRNYYCYAKPQYTSLPEGLCPVAPSERQECGYYGIKKDECLAKLCCWDESVPNAKWCFKRPQEPPQPCHVTDSTYGLCLYACSPEDERLHGLRVCLGRICCYRKFGQA